MTWGAKGQGLWRFLMKNWALLTFFYSHRDALSSWSIAVFTWTSSVSRRRSTRDARNIWGESPGVFNNFIQTHTRTHSRKWRCRRLLSWWPCTVHDLAEKELELTAESLLSKSQKLLVLLSHITKDKRLSSSSSFITGLFLSSSQSFL